jgi:hypothetical protein
VSADRETLEISLASSGPKTIFIISLLAGINNVLAIVCAFFLLLRQVQLLYN